MDRILVVDFGGQYAHLIANRLRRLGFLGDITNNENILKEIKKGNVKGIILSGGPASVYEKNSPDIPDEIFKLNIPILGLCYGHQLIAHKLKGEVKKGNVREYGIAKINIKKSLFFAGLNKKETVWMSHGDTVYRLPSGFAAIASTPECPVAAMENKIKKIYGLQFHPEVTHTVHGMKILENFASNICECKREWDSNTYMKEISENIKEKTENKKVFLLVSGGVDSTVLFTLLNKILGKKRVFGLHVDTGLMRENESNEVKNALLNLGFDNLEIIDASKMYFNALKNAVNPENKRKIMGNLFIDVLSEKSEKILSSEDWIIAQGTIYPDTIETQGTKNADLIKTHHNRVKRMQKLIKQGKVIEPLSHLYKDEVRTLGRKLGLPENIINRHPFPGPGLGVRILCNDKNAEDISEIDKKLEKIQKNSFVLPIKSVGVQGDSRTYRHPAVIVSWKNWDELEKISTKITNNVPEINRVLLLIKGKNGKISLLKKTITEERVKLLKKADSVVTQIIKKHNLYNKIWQMPVVLVPLSILGGESIILRPVDSTEAMTARFSRIPKHIVKEISNKILNIKDIDAVFYDITNKPPATIEWE